MPHDYRGLDTTVTYGKDRQMKISSVKLFEVNQLPPDLQAKVSPLVGFVNGLADEVIRALQKKLNFEDNVDAETIQAKVTHERSTVVVVREAHRVTGIIPVKVIGELRDAVLGVNWQVRSDGAIDLFVYTARHSKTPITCSFLVLYG